MMKVWTIKSTESGWYVADANRDLEEVIQTNELEAYEIQIVECVEYNKEFMKVYYDLTK
ncbi:MAG: hypothetical protein ACON45_04925 [Paracoccaceae bacterium]